MRVRKYSMQPFTEDKATGETQYQFLYSSDNVEVMTDQGFTIATFNRKAESLRAVRD